MSHQPLGTGSAFEMLMERELPRSKVVLAANERNCTTKATGILFDVTYSYSPASFQTFKSTSIQVQKKNKTREFAELHLEAS